MPGAVLQRPVSESCRWDARKAKNRPLSRRALQRKPFIHTTQILKSEQTDFRAACERASDGSQTRNPVSSFSAFIESAHHEFGAVVRFMDVGPCLTEWEGTNPPVNGPGAFGILKTTRTAVQTGAAFPIPSHRVGSPSRLSGFRPCRLHGAGRSPAAVSPPGAGRRPSVFFPIRSRKLARRRPMSPGVRPTPSPGREKVSGKGRRI
jgi:hypothetical protein